MSVLLIKNLIKQTQSKTKHTELLNIKLRAWL